MDRDKIIICAVTNDLSQDQRMHRICETLSETYSVRLVGRKRKESVDLQSFPFQIKRLSCWFESSFLFYIEYNIRLFIYLLNQKFTCVNANDLDTLMACRLAALIKRKQFVFDAHEIFTEVPELSSSSIKRWIWKTIGSISLIKSNYNYTVNGSLSNHLENKYNVAFQVVQNYPKCQEEVSVSKARSPLKFIYQGVMNQGRGIENIIEAVKAIPEVQLVLAGRGDLDQTISELISGFENRISYVGFLPPSELKILTRKCHVGLNILTEDSLNYYYSSANKYFDYIMADIPCISMDFPEYRLANELHHTAILIKSNDREDIVMAMKEFINDDKLYQRLQANCKTAKKEFTWETQQDILLQLYKKAMQ